MSCPQQHERWHLPGHCCRRNEKLCCRTQDRLNVKAGVLAQQYHILYQNEHCRTGSKLTLTLQQDTGDDRDGSDDTTKGSLVPQSIVTASQSSQEKEDMYGKDKNKTDFAESIGA